MHSPTMRGWKSFTYAPTWAQLSLCGSSVTNRGTMSGSEEEDAFFSAGQQQQTPSSRRSLCAQHCSRVNVSGRRDAAQCTRTSSSLP